MHAQRPRVCTHCRLVNWPTFREGMPRLYCAADGKPTEPIERAYLELMDFGTVTWWTDDGRPAGGLGTYRSSELTERVEITLAGLEPIAKLERVVAAETELERRAAHGDR